MLPQDILDKLAPMLYADAQNGQALQRFLEGISSPIEDIESWVSETDDGPGWSALVDVNRAPAEVLPWLAQFVGSDATQGLSESDQRQQIQDAPRWKRGSPGSLAAAPYPYLTGTHTVVFRERYDPANPGVDSPYYIYVITYTSETPDPLLVAAALMTQKPGGDILNYVVHSGQDYTSLRTNHADYLNVRNTYATYNGVKIDQPGV